MILIDSSVWINYYRSDGEPRIKQIVIDAIDKDLVAINGIIMVEILSGISRKKEFEKVKNDFMGFHILPINDKVFLKSATIGSYLRRKGITVPSTDLIIAASAINSKSILYHIDNHFDMIAKHTELKAKNLSKL